MMTSYSASRHNWAPLRTPSEPYWCDVPRGFQGCPRLTIGEPMMPRGASFSRLDVRLLMAEIPQEFCRKFQQGSARVLSGKKCVGGCDNIYIFLSIFSFLFIVPFIFFISIHSSALSQTKTPLSILRSSHPYIKDAECTESNAKSSKV